MKKMTGKYFKDYINQKFETVFQKADQSPYKLWTQDGCPCQNSNAAKSDMMQSGAIPPRSPDINPIKNLFHLV